MLTRFLNWLSGWRLDLDDWWVRARRATDPDLIGREDLGFTDEASIMVRTPGIARDVDRLAGADPYIRDVTFGVRP